MSDRTPLSAWIAAHGITSTADPIDTRPDGLMTDSAYHFKVTLRYGRRRMAVLFSQGSAHTEAPDAADVLNCLASDYTICRESFDAFCGELGSDPDSRAAERTYRACVKQGKALDRFLGPVLVEQLAYHVEGL